MPGHRPCLSPILGRHNQNHMFLRMGRAKAHPAQRTGCQAPAVVQRGAPATHTARTLGSPWTPAQSCMQAGSGTGGLHPRASPGSSSALCPSLSRCHPACPVPPAASRLLSPASHWLTQPRFPSPQPRSPPSARLWARWSGVPASISKGVLRMRDPWSRREARAGHLRQSAPGTVGRQALSSACEPLVSACPCPLTGHLQCRHTEPTSATGRAPAVLHPALQPPLLWGSGPSTRSVPTR